MREAKLAADPYIIKGEVKGGSEFDSGLAEEEAEFERERATQDIADEDGDGPSPEISALMKTMEEYEQSANKRKKKIVYKVEKVQLDVAGTARKMPKKEIE